MMSERAFDRLDKLRAERAFGYRPPVARTPDERAFDDRDRGIGGRSNGRSPDDRPDRGTSILR